jgi:hypothetical protein
MAIITRYFSTTAAGAEDGTTWADRAALFTTGNWSSVLTGFAFNASDSLEIRIEGGLTYTCGQGLAAGLFANPPSAANPLFMRGCDSSGNLLDPPDSGWLSSEGLFSTATLPVIATTGNIATVSLTNTTLRCLAFTASGRQGNVIGGANCEWVSVVNSTANTSSSGISASSLYISNSQVLMSGASFSDGVVCVDGRLLNVRIDGTAGVTSGNRIGVTTASSGYQAAFITVVGCVGGGMFAATGATTRFSNFYRCTLVGNGAYGIQCNGTASQTVNHNVVGCYFANNTTVNLDASGARVNALGNRLRDSTANFANFGNYPTDSNYTTDSDDATEFVNAGSGDYRIKNTAAVWGLGYGAGDEPAAGGGGGGGPLIGGRLVQ